MIRLLFLLLSVANHGTSEYDQSPGSKHNFLRLFDTRLDLPDIPGLQRRDPPSVQGSILPPEDNLETQFLLNFGRQNRGCTCNAVLVDNGGFCGTTCFTTETQCGQICTRTTTFSGFTAEVDFMPKIKRFLQIDEKACAKLKIDCMTSSLLSMASSSSAVAATAIVVANIALSAGIAAGIAALAFAAKENDPPSDGYHYDETKDLYETETDYTEGYARRLLQNVNDDNGIAGLALPGQTGSEKNSLLEDVVVGGSILPFEENLDVPHFLRTGRQSGCNCYLYGFVDYACTTMCLSFTKLCNGQICTITTSVSSFSQNAFITSVRVTDVKDCDTLANACALSSAASSVLSAANARSNSIALNAGIAGVISAGLAGGNIAAVAVSNSQQTNNNVNNQQINDNSNNEVPPLGNQTPTNNLASPVPGADFTDDGAGDNSVQFDDGNSYPLLTRGPCNGTNFWVTVNPVTLKGGCTPKLCDDRRVFVGRTGLCHDINDPFECQGGRRLYYTAYGDPICDCPIGKYPFPNSTDNCVALFSRGPCPARQVVTISQGGRLFCAPEECPSNGGEGSLQLVTTEKGECFALGLVGPCSTPELLAYDIFERQLECINITDPSSPYFTPSSQENELIDRIFLDALTSYQFHQDDNDLQFGLAYRDRQGIVKRKTQRQDANTEGIFQLPSSLPDTLLQPCRTGARQAENFKCTNPLISDLAETGLALPPVDPNFSCPDSTFLQATGQCVDDTRTTSCGPSMRFNEATGQCRSIF